MFDTLIVKETEAQLQHLLDEEGGFSIVLTVKAVENKHHRRTLKQLWEQRTELSDVLEGRVVLLTRDEVPFLAEVDDVQQSDDRDADKVLVTLR